MLIIIAGIGACYFYVKIQGSLFTEDSKIFIKNDRKPQKLFEQLHTAGRINTVFFPTYLAKFKKLHQLKSGYYFFKKGTSCNAFINTLRAGRQTPLKLTFNNARTLDDFATKIAGQLQMEKTELLHLLNDEKLTKSYGFDKADFIGLFLPNTYEVYYTISPKSFIDRMFKEYQRFWNAERKAKAKKLGYSPKEISILASIVDEETNKNDEKRRIAGVYLNRLKRGMPLQADPTLKFAVGNFSLKRILNIHKEINSPYNTYKYRGLPPSPIRQPSIAGIDAVLNAEKHNYLYFCAKADFSGYHAFAKTLAEHNRNANLYHRELNKRGIR